MYKNYKVICSKCGWEGIIEEEELKYGLSVCPICNKKNTLNITQEETEKLVRADLTYGMRENFKHLGKDRTWNIINHLVGETRLSYILIYLNALQEENEITGDNYPTF